MSQNEKNATLAFIGAGNMGKSLIKGLLHDGYPASNIWVSDHQSSHLIECRETLGIQVAANNHEAVSVADVVVLAVKPQQLKELIIELKTIILDKKPLLLSIAAGIRTQRLEEWLGSHMPVVRAMPNTPALVGSGATGIYANGLVSEAQRELAESVLRAVGLTVWVDHEAELDIVTALSGSGPAYFFAMMEALCLEAQNLGMKADVARLLSMQTALGAAKLAFETSLDFAELRAQVTSKGGTTERAMQRLNAHGFYEAVRDAVRSSAQRAQELADENY
jgi:pyrroline-5-carboxylate reductase